MLKWAMRLMIGLGLAWACLWFVVAGQLKTRVADWFAQQEAAGLVAENTGLEVAGWPYRFDLTVQGLHLAETGWDWQAPFAQVFAMGWKPWHLIAALPGGQKITLPDQVLTLETDRIEASLRMAPQAGFPPREARIDWPGLTVTSSEGWAISTGHLLGAALATEDQALKLWLQVDDLTLPQGSDLGGLGAVVKALRFDARLPLAAPLEWEGEPAIEGVEIRTLDLSWGGLDIEGQGNLVADANGQAEGTVTLRITGWQALPDVAIDLGLIQPGLRGGLMGALEGIAKSGEDPAELVLPVVMKGGLMSFGPLPLGPAPYLQ